jgi:hypothetical protein
MKIRLAENSIRYRLRQPEVQSFQNNGIVSTRVVFGEGDILLFDLIKTDNTKMEVAYACNHVTIKVPVHLCEEWIKTDLVGIEATVETAHNHFVSILIEKDFACLDAPAEENEGAYANPKALC